LRAIDVYKGTFVVRSAFRLAPQVFVRPGELRMAKWADLSLDEAEWTMKLSKRDESKPCRDDIDDYLMVPLARQMVEILRAVHASTRDDLYVFPGARDRNRPMSENAILTTMRRMGNPKDPMCGHDFRATARTILRREPKSREDLIEHELGRQVIDPNGRAYKRGKVGCSECRLPLSSPLPTRGACEGCHSCALHSKRTITTRLQWPRN
jgi:integrase